MDCPLLLRAAIAGLYCNWRTGVEALVGPIRVHCKARARSTSEMDVWRKRQTHEVT